MTKDSIITARINTDLKQDTEQILQALGLTPSQAITLFYRQISLNQGLPFPVTLPNVRTRKALREAQERYNLETFNDVDELFEDLHS